jgi:peptidoglycan hydrolase-like protein with peptidoglycan-binding domain
MRETQKLNELIADGAVTTSLHKGSSAGHAIEALQTLLHWLGFDKQLKWEQFGADGDYGSTTIAAVADFARRNGSSANGERVTAAIAGKILARYESLEELKQLAEDVGKERIERFYKVGSGEQIRVAALQTLLHDLGYDEELNWKKYGADGSYGRSSTAAVAAFAADEGLGGDGSALTLPQAKNLVARLSRFYGAGWNTPAHRPTPAPGSLSLKSVTRSNNRQNLEVSDGVLTKSFGKFSKGLFTTGSQKPANFVSTHAAALRDLKITESELNVMISVAENEGKLDAINTWDNAFLSFGMFQWTAGTGTGKGELPALLARIKEEDQDLFDKYCGQHGLDVVDVTPGYVYGYFSLRGTKIKSKAAKEQLRLAPWAFYFWRAGQDPAVQAIEIKHALGRLDQFYSTESYKVGGHLVSDLVTSEYGVGLILDNHVNRPAYVKACLAKALKQTGLSDPKGWGDDEEHALLDAYLKIRVTHGNSPMTDAEKRGRVTRKYLKNGTISDRRGSFKRSKS